MRDDITSIPISETFEPKDGCPICRLRNILDERSVVYITGAAMMEPDVRIETNKAGFCNKHYKKMLGQNKKLNVALILQSHLSEILETEIKKSGPLKLGKKASDTPSCFICSKLDRNMNQMLLNVCRLWEKEKDFRKLYSEQPFICLPHYRELLNMSEKMPRSLRRDFCSETTRLAENQLISLHEDITHFCNMFDYRNNGADWGNSKDSVERTIEYLTSEKVD